MAFYEEHPWLAPYGTGGPVDLALLFTQPHRDMSVDELAGFRPAAANPRHEVPDGIAEGPG